MRAKQAIVMLTTAIILVMVIGCATMGSMTPREEVVAAITDFQASIEAQDIEKMMDIYSDDFNFLDFIDPDFRALAQSNYQKHMQNQEVNPCEYTLLITILYLPCNLYWGY